MKRLCRVAVSLCIVSALSAVLRAEQRFPPPDFTDHELPATHFEPPPIRWMSALDVALLFAGLSLASYFALARRSRKGLFVLTVASLFWFGFYRQGCVCPIGAIQNVTLALCDTSYTMPLSVVAFFILPLVFTLFFGRTFCAAVCPLGAVQEMVALRPTRVPAWLDQTLGLLAWIYLGAAVMLAAGSTAFVICRYDPFVPMFRLSGSANMLIFGGSMLLIGVFVGRPYCRYLCPYGAILRVLSRVSKYRVSITPDECINCHLCEDVCPYGAIRRPTVDQPAERRQSGRQRLILLLALLPVLVAAGSGIGRLLAVPAAQLDPIVRLAERVRLEETGAVDDTTDASDAFRNTGRPTEELYRRSIRIRRQMAGFGTWLGAWVGLVIALKLLQLSIRRRRTDYEADQGRCIACGRCYWYCPQEQVRLGLISDVSEMVDTAQSTEQK